MAERRKGGSKLARSETVSVRLDPILRLAAELAAAKERRSLSSFIEWCVEQQTKNIIVDRSSYPDEGYSAYSVAQQVWEPETPDSFAKRALIYPDLLTVEELILWGFIKDAPYLWETHYNHGKKKWTWILGIDSLDKYKLRELWPEFLSAADGDENAKKKLDEAREKYIKNLPPPPPLEKKEEDIDDIPF